MFFRVVKMPALFHDSKCNFIELNKIPAATNQSNCVTQLSNAVTGKTRNNKITSTSLTTTTTASITAVRTTVVMT